VRHEYGAKPKEQFVPHLGYVSVFPLALQLVPWDSVEIPELLRLIRHPEHLWTAFGLRSLSKSSSMYNRHNTETDEPYWRGPIWLNINFLVLRSLDACFRCTTACVNITFVHCPTEQPVLVNILSHIWRHHLSNWRCPSCLRDLVLC
jgi:hypothetical protein